MVINCLHTALAMTVQPFS